MEFIDNYCVKYANIQCYFDVSTNHVNKNAKFSFFLTFPHEPGRWIGIRDTPYSLMRRLDTQDSRVSDLAKGGGSGLMIGDGRQKGQVLQ